MSNPKWLYSAQEVAEWLLAEQAHRYRQDLDRLGDERDEAVAQHDRDAETIAELRTEVGYWNNDYAALLAENARLREEIACVDRCDKSCVELTERLTAERDEARSILKLAEGVAAALPDPDVKNPEHLRFAADLIQKETDGNPRIFVNARMLHENADRIEAAQSATAQRDREIEAVAKAFDQAVESDVTDRDAAIAAIDALDAARAEAGQ